jgi:hypothetical protein
VKRVNSRTFHPFWRETLKRVQSGQFTLFSGLDSKRARTLARVIGISLREIDISVRGLHPFRKNQTALIA